MADGSLPPRAGEGDDNGAAGTTDLTTLPDGRPFESALHPAGSGRSRWAQEELGELLGPSWLEEPKPEPEATTAPTDPPPSGAIWEIERMPSEAEGGVVGLLMNGRRDGAQPQPPPAGAASASASWSDSRPDAPASGMARLTEMLDHLPTDSVTRLTPDDVDVATTAPAPPGVWFWGDDDIYPGKVPGVVGTHAVSKRRPRRSR
jgi:hypothetical protein